MRITETDLKFAQSTDLVRLAKSLSIENIDSFDEKTLITHILSKLETKGEEVIYERSNGW